MITPRRLRLMILAAFAACAVLISMSTLSWRAGAAHADEATSTPQVDASLLPSADAAPDAATSTPAAAADSSASSSAPVMTIASSTDGTGGISGAGGAIATGTSTATTTVQNEVNTNRSDPDALGTTNSSTITASTTNEADLGSVASSSASTGDNQASGGTGSSTIVTGAAIAAANVINVVNTNIFNSEGLIVFLNQLFGGGLDLRSYDFSYFFEPGATSSAACTILSCLNSSALNVFNTNAATVANSVLVRAATGANAATSTGDGSATIRTGDAYAAANVLNLVNTNLIDSHYLLVSFNNFGNLAQDITLPNADFWTQLLAHGGFAPKMNSSTFGVNNTNGADFTGTTTAAADTGGNTATSTATGTAAVLTGDAYSSASTFDQLNANEVGGTSVFLLFRVWGDWTGQIQGLPPGLSWKQTQNGIEIVSDASAVAATTTLGTYNSSSFLASSTNQANIENDVHVYALTGENMAATENGTSTVSTGNAYAAANVVNLVNTNVIGRNWIFAIFNIFGSWSGDIAFGKPDLWIGAVVDTPNPTPPGSEVTYKFTVANHGDTDAHDVTLRADFDPGALSFSSPDASTTDTGVTWRLGTIERGQTRDFSYTARVRDVSPGTTITIPLTARVSSDVSDTNPLDDTEQVTIVVGTPAASAGPSGGGGGGAPAGTFGAFSSGAWTADPKITITKTASVATSSATSTADYTVDIFNDKAAGPLYGATLTDTLYDATGTPLFTRSWALDTVAPGDEIMLTYSIRFATSTAPGAYRNVARVSGRRGSPGFLGVTTAASSSADVLFGSDGMVRMPGWASSTPQVLGTSTAVRIFCEQLISTHLARGKKNRPGEVATLQAFLNAFMGERLPRTGFYGPQTTAAVSRFQLLYTKDILAPWKLKKPTGTVRATTQNKINEIACAAPHLTALAKSAPPSAAATLAWRKAGTAGGISASR